MSQRWYYQMFGEEFGPVTEPHLRQLREDGTLSDSDSVRQEAFHDWLAITEAFPDDSVGTADEIAELSELAFSFEDSGSSARRRTYSTESAPCLTSAEPVNHGCDPAEHVVAAETSPMYYCRSLGETLGPMPFADIAEMAQTGSLSESDPVRCGEDGDWIAAGDNPELAATLLMADRVVNQAATISSAKQHRPGTTAVAGLAVAPEEVEPSPEVPSKPLPTVPEEQPRTKASASRTPETPVRRKSRKPQARKGEEVLLDEIFDEVFAEEDKPVRPSTSVYSPASTAVVESRAEPPRPAMPLAPQVSASAVAAASAAAARSSSGATLSSKKSSVSFSLPVLNRNVVIAVVLLVAAVGYIYQFGMPAISFSSTSPAEYPTRLKAAMDACKALGDTPSERSWRIFADSTRSEFMTYHKNLVSGDVADPKAKACMPAIRTLMDITATSFDQKQFRDEYFAKLEKQMLALGL